MSFLARFRRKKEDPEVARRRMLLQSGRLGEGTIFETSTDGNGQMMMSYSYTVGGVDYQAFQRLDEEQLQRTHDYLPGARVELRYDPQRPANSVVI